MQRYHYNATTNVHIRCKKTSQMDLLCKENDFEHRLTQSHTPKTNGMVERANGIVKSNTILKEQYASNQDMEVALMQFLVFYMLSRRHSSLKIELGVPPHLRSG